MNYRVAKKWHILVVDENLCEFPKLEDVAAGTPFQFCAVSSCEQAIQFIRAFGWPHVIVTEREFSKGMDGFSFGVLVRDISSVPVIMYSAKVPTRQMIEAIDEFADDYMIKPVSSEMVLSRVRRLIKRVDFVPELSGVVNGRFAITTYPA